MAPPYVRVTVQQPAGGSRTSWYRVTGTAVFAPSDGTGGLGTGAAFTLDGLLSPRCGRLPAGAARSACRLRTVFGVGGDILVTTVPGPRGQADLARLASAYPAEVNLAYPPTSLVNFGEVNFPLLFGLAVAVFGAATLVHAPLAVANLIAAGPAVAAARTRPTVLLRAE